MSCTEHAMQGSKWDGMCWYGMPALRFPPSTPDAIQ